MTAITFINYKRCQTDEIAIVNPIPLLLLNHNGLPEFINNSLVNRRRKK